MCVCVAVDTVWAGPSLQCCCAVDSCWMVQRELWIRIRMKCEESNSFGHYKLDLAIKDVRNVISEPQRQMSTKVKLVVHLHNVLPFVMLFF